MYLIFYITLANIITSKYKMQYNNKHLKYFRAYKLVIMNNGALSSIIRLTQQAE